MQTVSGGATAAFHQQGIVCRRPIAGNDMDFTPAAQGFLNQINVFDDSRIHRGDFARVVAAQDLIDVVQRRQIVVAPRVAVADPQPLIRMDVIKRQLAFRERISLSTREARREKPSAHEEDACNRGFQKRSSGPRPIRVMQRVTPERRLRGNTYAVKRLVPKSAAQVNPKTARTSCARKPTASFIDAPTKLRPADDFSLDTLAQDG